MKDDLKLARGFWEWFSKIADKLSENLENPAILSELDQRILALKSGRLSWEVGPGTEQENLLVISPSGDEQLLEFTKRIVECAPVIQGWEFWPAKPPKKSWCGEFEFQIEAGEFVRVEAANWEYVLFKFKDKTFDILIKQIGLTPVEEYYALCAAEIALDGYLGERVRLETIKEVEVVVEFDEAIRGKVNCFPVLADHLKAIWNR